MTANWTGVIIPLIYLAIFVFYSKTSAARLRISVATALVLASTWTFLLAVYLAPDPVPFDRNKVVGSVTAAVNITFFLSPLKQIYLGVRHLDMTHIPVLLSCVAVVQSSLWVAASILLEDNFILIVNAIGLFFALLQLSCIGYIRYAMRKREKRLAFETASTRDFYVDGDAPSSRSVKVVATAAGLDAACSKQFGTAAPVVAAADWAGASSVAPEEASNVSVSTAASLQP